MKYELWFFEQDYQPVVYELDREKDEVAALGQLESNSPFMPINVGDYIDPRLWPRDPSAYFKVLKVEHVIAEGLQRVNVFVQQLYREVKD
jgi:hypothetical protein